MKIVLERHRYAPELNAAYVGPNQVRIAAPGCTTIKEVREKLFSPVKQGRYAKIKVTYPGTFAWLGRQNAGYIQNYLELKEALRVVKARLAVDHNPQVVVTTRLIG